MGHVLLPFLAPYIVSKIVFGDEVHLQYLLSHHNTCSYSFSVAFHQHYLQADPLYSPSLALNTRVHLPHCSSTSTNITLQQVRLGCWHGACFITVFRHVYPVKNCNWGRGRVPKTVPTPMIIKRLRRAERQNDLVVFRHSGDGEYHEKSPTTSTVQLPAGEFFTASALDWHHKNATSLNDDTCC